jgi:hypothetical protein
MRLINSIRCTGVHHIYMIILVEQMGLKMGVPCIDNIFTVQCR